MKIERKNVGKKSMLEQQNYRLHLEPSCVLSQIKVIFFLNKKEKIRKCEFQKKS